MLDIRLAEQVNYLAARNNQVAVLSFQVGGRLRNQPIPRWPATQTRLPSNGKMTSVGIATLLLFKRGKILRKLLRSQSLTLCVKKTGCTTKANERLRQPLGDPGADCVIYGWLASWEAGMNETWKAP